METNKRRKVPVAGPVLRVAFGIPSFSGVKAVSHIAAPKKEHPYGTVVR